MQSSIPPLIFSSVDQLLSAAGLAQIASGAATSIERLPLEVAHFSGNALERVIVRVAGAERRFVLKRFSIERDWIMRLTHDHAVREVALYRHSIYARLPKDCYVPIVATARDGETWASLMDDVSAGLPVANGPLKLDDLRRYLTHLATRDDAALRPGIPGTGRRPAGGAHQPTRAIPARTVQANGRQGGPADGDWR